MDSLNQNIENHYYKEELYEDIIKRLKELGLAKEQSTNQTQAGIDFFNTLVAKLKEFGPPKMGLNVLMGETIKPKLMNLLTHLQADNLELKSGVYKKNS